MKKECEACDREVQGILVDQGEDKPYHLCNNCMFALINTCLSKEQFKKLIVCGHQDNEFYLHDDFYDEDGNALQPSR
jgi:hypothetical protein